MNRDEETHDELMRLFREYFKMNQQWINKGTRVAGLETRQLLAQIRIVARDRRARIQEWRHWIDAEKAQKKGLDQDDDAN